MKHNGKTCLDCEHCNKDMEEDPCKYCYFFDRWEKKKIKTAEETIKEWERRIFDDLK